MNRSRKRTARNNSREQSPTRPAADAANPGALAAPPPGVVAANRVSPTRTDASGNAPGRPPGAAPPVTRAALIRVGRRLFAHQGYDATSVRQLTSEAGANLGAVTYHFGSKKALYHAVLEDALAPFASRVIAAAESEGDALERAARVVQTYFDVLREYPDVPFLLLQEMMARRAAPAPVTTTLRRVSATLGTLVAEGQAAGTIRPGDALLFALSIVAQPTHMSIVTKLLTQVAGVDQQDSATRERVYAHTAAFVQAGLRAEGKE